MTPAMYAKPQQAPDARKDGAVDGQARLYTAKDAAPMPAPRDPAQYQAASRAAGGRPVDELDAAAVMDGMTIWDKARETFGPVRRVKWQTGVRRIDFLMPEGQSSIWYADGTRPAYRLLPAVDQPQPRADAAACGHGMRTDFGKNGGKT